MVSNLAIKFFSFATLSEAQCRAEGARAPGWSRAVATRHSASQRARRALPETETSVATLMILL